MHNLLLDTGAFVALLDKSEKSHERCVDFFANFTGEVLTTEPVLIPQGYQDRIQTGRRQGMNIVDSSGWLSYFADEPNAKHFLSPLIRLLSRR